MASAPLRSRYRPFVSSHSHPLSANCSNFWALVNFYHRFVPNCALILQPLHDLLKGAPKGNTPLTWTDAATKAFHSIKDALADATLLVHPRPNAPTCILTDASSAAVGAVLQQRIGDTWCPLAYFSRKFTPAQTKYSTLRVVGHQRLSTLYRRP